MLKPQDIVVLVHLALRGEGWTYPTVAAALGMSSSEAHAALKRASAGGLYDEVRRVPRKRELMELIEHGLRYVFPVDRGSISRGHPTAHGAPPLRERIRLPEGEPIPVWPDPEGEARGEAWAPLYPSVPKAARGDQNLYEALALIDAVRGGRARERALALKVLTERLA
ncbi:MAG TPA: hypothetical protein PLU22_07375 [Polyangiaceae bacterium]|nr:hypothetical protein [Polyangiaceae bacterium]